MLFFELNLYWTQNIPLINGGKSMKDKMERVTKSENRCCECRVRWETWVCVSFTLLCLLPRSKTETVAVYSGRLSVWRALDSSQGWTSLLCTCPLLLSSFPETSLLTSVNYNQLRSILFFKWQLYTLPSVLIYFPVAWQQLSVPTPPLPNISILSF